MSSRSPTQEKTSAAVTHRTNRCSSPSRHAVKYASSSGINSAFVPTFTTVASSSPEAMFTSDTTT